MTHHENMQAMFARTDKALLAEHEAREQREQWPLRVQQVLDELRGQVAALRERVEQLERKG
ncbi:hypothetical protein AAG593_07895 [Citromicrobium bathyomarinum]